MKKEGMEKEESGEIDLDRKTKLAKCDEGII